MSDTEQRHPDYEKHDRYAEQSLSPSGGAPFNVVYDLGKHGGGLCFLAERLGSGDGERKTLLTRQMPYEPLPASVLFALVFSWWSQNGHISLYVTKSR